MTRLAPRDIVLAWLCAFAIGCAPATAPRSAPRSPPPAATSFEDSSPLARYHSRRLELWLPLPTSRAWHIEDGLRPELIATHAATQSRIVVAILHANELVGRTQCEELAYATRLAPDRPLQTIDDEITTTQRTFDTHIRVAIAAPDHDGGPIVGNVLAFGGYLRKCYVFVFSTEVPAATDEPALSARLAFARTRILGGLELGGLGSLSRNAAMGPERAPGR